MSSIKNALNKARNYALKRTDIEILVRDATSNEKWGPSGTQMSQIAQATFSHADFTLVMNTLWERINDHGKNWRHIYKALLVIEYLLRCGSERVISDCRSKMIEIKTLIEFQKIDDHDKDVGYSIRERAKHVVEMLHDDKRLQDEREKAAKNRDKYHVAVSNVGGSGPQYSSTSSAYNSTSSAYNTGSTRKPMTSMGYTPGQGTYGSAMRETRDRDSSRDSHGSGLEPRGSFRSSSQSNSRETTRDSSRDQPPRATTQSRARAPSISDDEYSISDDEPQRPSTTQPRRPSNSAPNTNNTTVDDFFAPRGGSFVSAPSTAPTPAANSTDPLWALLAGPSAPSQPTVPTMNSGYTPFSFPPAPTSSTTTPTTNGAMLFQNSVPSTTHSFQAMSLNTASVSNNTGNFFPSPRKDEDDWKDFTKTGTSSNTPSTNSLSNQLGVKSDLIDLDSLTANKRVDTKPGAATTYRPIVASSTTAMTPNGGMMNNTMGYNMNTPTMGGNMMNPNNMGTGMTYNGNMMMNNTGMNTGMNNMGMNTGMNPNNGMMMNNTGMMNPNGNMMNPNMMNNNMMYNNSMMTPNGGMMMNNYGMQPVNNNANSFKF